MKTLLTISTISLALMSGAAFAQTATMDADMQTRTGIFYSDDSRTTLVTPEEFTTAFEAMSEEDRAALRLQCEDINENKSAFEATLTDACSNFPGLGASNDATGSIDGASGDGDADDGAAD